MKTVKKIMTLLLIWLLTISNVFAEWFPDEPMVIYGSIKWITWEKISIYNANHELLKEAQISNNKFWTNKTFDLENKIILNKFEWSFIFEINWKSLNILGTNSDCNLFFQKWKVCEYILTNSIEISWEFVNLKQDDITTNIQDLSEWKIFKKNKEDIQDKLIKNIIKNVNSKKEIIIFSQKLNIKKDIKKDVVIVSQNKKESLYISENTKIIENNVIIEKPQIITNKNSIKNKINKNIAWAVKIPTNKKVTFDKDIQVCTEIDTNSISWLSIYYSHDEISWIKDSNTKNLEISNWIICFDVNHLTSFAVSSGPTINNSSSWGSSWGSSWKVIHMDICNNTKGDTSWNYYDKKCTKDWIKSETKESNKKTINIKKINTNNTQSQKNDIIKKINKINPNIKTIKWNNTYNTIILILAKQAEIIFTSNEYKNEAFEKLNQITDLKNKNLSKEEFKKELLVIKRKIKLLIIKEKILKRHNAKKSIR
jgi:hypothetical protein